MTFRDLIYGLAGGIREDRKIKFFIPGGASSQWLTGSDEHLDAPLDMDFVQQTFGVMLGSGAVMVFDETVDPLLVAWRLAKFFAHESCGKCTPCREGTGWVEKVLYRMSHGLGRPEDLDLLVRRRRQHLARARERAVRADHDLPARSVGRELRREPQQVLPRRGAGAPAQRCRSARVTTTESDAPEAPKKTTVTVTVDGITFEAQPGRAADQGRAGERRLHPALLLARAHEAGRHVPHVPRRDRRRPRLSARVHDPRHRRHGRALPERRGEADPGRRARVPAHQPPARLPGVRPRRRVPVAGPDARVRSGRVALRRGEAPLPEADPAQRARPARPRALHPVRALHPLRRRDRGRRAHRLHRPRRPHAGPELRRAAVRLVLLGQHRADLPGRRAHREPVPLPGPAVGPLDGRDVVHDVFGAVPRCGAVVVEPSRAAARRRLRAGEPRLAVRQGPLRARVGPLRQSGARAAGPRRRHAARGLVARRARPRRRRDREGEGTARAGVDRGARRRARHERGRVRLVGARQGRDRHRPRRRPARRRPARPTSSSGWSGPRSPISTRRARSSSSTTTCATRFRCCSSGCAGRCSSSASRSSTSRPWPTALSEHAAVVSRRVPGERIDDRGARRDHARAPKAAPDPSSWSSGAATSRPAPDSVVGVAADLGRVHDVRFLSALRRGNVHGALDAGLAPGFLPGRVTLDAGREWFSERVGRRPRRARPRRRGHPARRRRRQDPRARALRVRPDRRLPRRHPRPPGDRRGRHDHRGRRLRVGVDRTGRRVPARARSGARRRARSPTSRAACSGSAARWRPKAPRWTTGASRPSSRCASDATSISRTVDEVTDEIARVAPAFAGVDRRGREAAPATVWSCRSPRTLDEIVLRTRDLTLMADDGSGTSWDPIKVEGEAPDGAGRRRARSPRPTDAPALYEWDGHATQPEAPGRDAYALRLVVGRALYDDGRLVSRDAAPAAPRRRSGAARAPRAIWPGSASTRAAR